MVSAAVIAMRRCNSRDLGGWLRSQQASAAHVAERAVGQRARIAKGASGVLVLDASRRGAACASARGQTGRRCARALVGSWAKPPASMPSEARVQAACGLPQSGRGGLGRLRVRLPRERPHQVRFAIAPMVRLPIRIHRPSQRRCARSVRALCTRSSRGLPAHFAHALCLRFAHSAPHCTRTQRWRRCAEFGKRRRQPGCGAETVRASAVRWGRVGPRRRGRCLDGLVSQGRSSIWTRSSQSSATALY
jgi:hypothetical protein